MSGKEPTKDQLEKDQSKFKEKNQITVKQTTMKKDSAKRVPGTGGTRYQDPKTGRFRKAPSPESIRQQSPKTERKLGVNLGVQDEKGPLKYSGMLSASPGEVSIKGKADFVPYKSDDGHFSIKAAGIQAEATLSTKGVSLGFEVVGPMATVKGGKKICISKSTSVNVEAEVGVGLGFGGKGKGTIGKNRTNNAHRLTVEAAIGTGERIEGKLDLDLNLHDEDSCTPSVFDNDNQSLPSPQPNAPLLPTMTPISNSSPSPMPNRGPASVAVDLPEMEDDDEESSTSLPSTAEMRSEISRGLELLGADSESIERANNQLISDESIALNYRHIQRAITLEQIGREEFTHHQIVGIGQSLDFLQNLGGVLKCEPLSKTAVVGKHLLKAYETYSKISKMGFDKFIQGGLGAVLGGIATFGGSLIGIIGAFFGGPDPTQLILDAIQGVSDQVRTLDTDMREYFRQQANNQEYMYRRMMKGFDLLHEQIETGITSIRTDLVAMFEELEHQLNFMMQLLNRGQQAILLQPLTERCDEVIAWTTGKNNGDPKQNIPRLANQLLSDFESLTTNPALNGRNVWEVYCRDGLKPDVVSEFLKLEGGDKAAQRSEDFNWFLSYLGSYAVESRKRYITKKELTGAKAVDYKPASLPNPIVQYRVLNSYLTLKHAHPVFDNDPNGEDLILIERHLRRSIKFIEDIKTDEVLFQSLVCDYYDALESIKNLQDEYITYESNLITRDCNASYATHEAELNQQYGLEIQGGITWNLYYETPDVFIAKFANRRINSIIRDVGVVDTIKDTHPQFSKKRLYACAHAGSSNTELMTVCAGEYLKLWSFTARQSCESNGRTWISKYWVPAIHISRAHRTEMRELNEGEELKLHHYQMWDHLGHGYPWVYPNAGLGRGAKAYAVDAPPALALSEADWTLNFDLMTANETAVQYVFKDSWTHAPGVRVNAWSDIDSLYVKKINGQHYVSYGEDGPAFQNGLKTHIFQRFNSDANTVTHTVSVPNATAFKTQLLNHIFAKRQAVAKALEAGRADGEGQNFVNAYRKALLKLDEIVALIKWFGVLTGKNMENDAFKKLISARTIDRECKEYYSATTANFDLVYSPSLIDTLKDRQTKEALLVSSLMHAPSAAVSELPKRHPHTILDLSLRKLQMFNQWRKLIVLEFPELADSSLEEYDLRCQIFGEQIFQETTHALLREINQKSYAKARFQVQNHMKYSTKMQASTYSKIFDECVRFTCVDSSTAVASGREHIVGSDLDDIKTQQSLFRIYRSGTGIARWAPNIGFLMDLFNRLTNKVSDLAPPPNFMIWSEGILTFLKLLFTEKLESVSEEAGYTIDGKIKALTDCLHSGLALKKFIYHLALSPEFFNILFFEYQKHLSKLKAAVARIANQYPNNDSEVFRQFAFKSAGQSHLILDGLASRGIVLALLVEILFEQDLKSDQKFKKAFLCLRDRDGLMSGLRESGVNTYTKKPLLKRLDTLNKRIELLKSKIFTKMNKVKRHYEFWMYLQNYFQVNKKSHIFLIDKSHFSFIQEDHGRLLSLFLNMHRHITSVLIGDLELDPHSVEWLSALLEPQDHIKEVYLSADHEYSKEGIQLLETALQSIKHKEKLVPEFEKISSKEIRKRSAALGLELGIGPPRLDQLIQISVNALKVLTKRQWAENRGYQLDSFMEVPFEAQRDLFLQLKDHEDSLRRGLQALEEEYAEDCSFDLNARGNSFG